MTTAARRPARAVAEVLATVLSAVAVTLIATAVPASAHDVLRSTNPADGAVVDRLPDRVVLTFDEPALAIGTEVVVTGPAGPVSDGPPQLVDAEVRQPVRAGPAGRYTVLWRVTSADGHPVSGTFAFTTQQGSAASPTATPATTTAPSTPTSKPELTTRSTYRNLIIRGLAPDEAANLTAYLAGIGVGGSRWTLRQINQLLFLRQMNRTGHFAETSDLVH